MGSQQSQGETKDGGVVDSVDTVPVTLTECFGQLYNNDLVSDVTFIVEGKKIPAHRLVLAVASPVFQEMLYKRNEDGKILPCLSEPVEVKIKDTKADDFLAMLQCIYTDDVEVSPSNIQGLISIAGKYQVDKLKIRCADFMTGDITKENVLDLFQIAPTMLGDEEFGLKFIEENAEDVLQSDKLLNLSRSRLTKILQSNKLTIDEAELFKHLLRWGKNELKKTDTEGADLKTVIGDLLKHIRFPIMPVGVIATVVAPTGLIDQKDLVGLFSYCSVPDPSLRVGMPDPGFPTQEREGSVKEFTWDIKKKGRSVTLSNNNLTAQMNGSSWQGGLILGAREFKQGDQYWEVKVDGGYEIMIGVASPTISPEHMNSVYTNNPSQVWFFYRCGNLYGGSGSVQNTSGIQTFTTNDTIGVYLAWNKDEKNYEMTCYKNGVRLGTFFKRIPAPVVAAVELYTSTDRVILNSKAKRPDLKK